ncbi:hypothetical protein AMTRI_Chr03g146440 [Amborella trichopoda]
MEGSKGLVIKSNKTLISFLLDASQLQTLSADLRTVAEDLSSKDSIPYKTLKDLWLSMPCSERPSLLSLLFSSEFLLQSPKPREKSEELKERLRKLAEDAEKKAYDDLIKDIAPKKQEEPFSSYRDQIGFGTSLKLLMIYYQSENLSPCHCDDVHGFFGWICWIQGLVWSKRNHECSRGNLRIGICNASRNCSLHYKGFRSRYWIFCFSIILLFYITKAKEKAIRELKYDSN